MIHHYDHFAAVLFEQIYSLVAEHQTGRGRNNLAFEMATRQGQGMEKLMGTTLYKDSTDPKQVFQVLVSYEVKVSYESK